jgi:predicted transcriptional regulator
VGVGAGGRRRRVAGQLEGEVLGVLYASSVPLTAAQVQRALDSGLAYTTVHTILTRLQEKEQVVRSTVDGRAVFAPAKDAVDSAAARMASVLDAALDRRAILARFITTLTDEDAAALRDVLDQLPPGDQQ